MEGLILGDLEGEKLGENDGLIEGDMLGEKDSALSILNADVIVHHVPVDQVDHAPGASVPTVALV